MSQVARLPGSKPGQGVLALFGPTSSGKTRLSIKLLLRTREDLGVEPVVIAADSRQVYQYMDIGTSKATRADMQGIRHEMLDLVEPTRKLELEAYVSRARERIAAHREAGRLPLIVGGTGVYVASLLEGWDVDGTASLRSEVKRDFPRSMTGDAYWTLRRLDRDAAKRVHPHNYEGIVNALVSVMSRSRPRGPSGASTTEPCHTLLGIDVKPPVLDKRIARTFDRQLEEGLLDEIRALDRRYGLEEQLRRHGRGSSNQVLQTHGYREYFEVAAERGTSVHSPNARDLDEAGRRAGERSTTSARIRVGSVAGFVSFPPPTR